jgi:toxin-antitoxin system PIN domain toxin
VSFSLDVNVLLYASNPAGAEHAAATAFIQRVAAGPELCLLAWPTLMGYLRIATHPAIFPRPLAPADALANVEQLLALPHVRTLSETDDFWPTYRALTRDLHVRGNLVPDAHLAALLHCHGVRTLYSRDRDFKKFDFLDLRDPLV